jgi:tetratricopeptide (TPR) repeat protein
MLYHHLGSLGRRDGQMNGEEKIKKAYESILGNDFEQAIEWFEQAIELEPNNAAYHYKLSITYARSNRLEEAIKHADTALQMDAKHKEYRFHLQHLQAKKLVYKAEKYFDDSEENLSRAVSLLKQATRLDPLAAEAFLLMGLAYAELNEYNEAVRAMKEVLKLDPQHDTAARLQTEYQSKL